MKSKMNKSKKRMKNKKGRNGNKTVKMRGGNSLKKYFRGDKVERIKQAKRIKQAFGKATKYVVDKTGEAAGKATEVASNAARATSAAVGKAFTATSYEKQFDKKVMENTSGKKDVINVIKKIENTKKIVTELNSKITKAYEQIHKVKDKIVDPRLNADISNFNEIIPDFYKNINLIIPHLKTILNNTNKTAQNKLKEIKNGLAQLEKLSRSDPHVAGANEFLAKVEKDEVEKIIEIIETIQTEFGKITFDTVNDKENIKENKILEIIKNYNENMNELIDVKRQKYKEIFENKKKNNYTKLENKTFFDRIIENIKYTHYDNLVNLYNEIRTNIEVIYTPININNPNDIITKLIYYCNNINKYDLSRFKDDAPTLEPKPTSEPTEDKNNKNKITDININFYKSNFKDTNPFPYYEQVVLNRTGQGVISDLYGVEELFPTFKGELEYIVDPTKIDIFKPFENKNIKIVHTKNDKSAPNL